VDEVASSTLNFPDWTLRLSALTAWEGTWTLKVASSLVFTLQRLLVPESLFPRCYNPTPRVASSYSYAMLRFIPLSLLPRFAGWMAGVQRKKRKRKEKVEKRKEWERQRKKRERKKIGENKKWII
jgi:hypothetical protein